ncbi:hypothetical protein HYN43_000275 [Mucilaginibacter celer]|uniref:Uncharacterized protein n=1 Tax=Mucilaginibacter celer TaxID=2305508 RepID=A0A494VI87_9SPHI|nr:hypothetical protein HYN43_000275 [Mucilaginibacter celer]
MFGYNEWFVGEYEKKQDTLFLTYHNDKRPARFGTKILINNGELRSLDKPKDSVMQFLPFKIR